jgi:hypothetical protein
MTDYNKAAGAATKFIRKFMPDCTRVLTAIDPDEGYIRTAGFAPGDEAAMRAFIYEWIGKRGLYFCPNGDLRPVADITNKSRKTDIGVARVLQVDLDRYKDEPDPTVGREKGLSLLADPPAGVPGPPSVIINSGNGLNAYWLLRAAVAIDGDLKRAAEVERYGRGLAQALGGDATFDVTRILRLPFTINLPNGKKRALGLKPVWAKVIKFEPTLTYDLEQFPTAEATGSRLRDPDVAARIIDAYQIGDAVTPDDIDDIDVSDRTRVIIELGHYPGEEREGGRSSWLFTVIKALIHCGEPDEIILGTIMNPDWEISESVLEKPDPEHYARRQIARAHVRISAEIAEELDEFD